jgi:hypothetical protein
MYHCVSHHWQISFPSSRWDLWTGRHQIIIRYPSRGLWLHTVQVYMKYLISCSTARLYNSPWVKSQQDCINYRCCCNWSFIISIVRSTYLHVSFQRRTENPQLTILYTVSFSKYPFIRKRLTSPRDKGDLDLSLSPHILWSGRMKLMRTTEVIKRHEPQVSFRELLPVVCVLHFNYCIPFLFLLVKLIAVSIHARCASSSPIGAVSVKLHGFLPIVSQSRPQIDAWKWHQTMHLCLCSLSKK